MGEAPTGRSTRLIVTEHGMRLKRAISRETEGPEESWKSRSSREDEKVVERREGAQVVDRESPCGTRDAESQSGTAYPLSPLATSLTTGERSETETVTQSSARGDGKRAMGTWYLASRLLYFL